MPIGNQNINNIDQRGEGVPGPPPPPPQVRSYLNSMGILNRNTMYWVGTPYEISGRDIYTAFTTWYNAIALENIHQSTLKWWCPEYGDTAFQHGLNFWDPEGNHDLIFAGGFNFSPGGATGNGINSAAIMTVELPFVANNTTIGLYSRTNNLTTEIEMGMRSSTGYPNDFALIARFSDGKAYTRCYEAVGLNVATADSLGDLLSTRVSTTDLRLFKNGAQLGPTDTALMTYGIPVLFKMYFHAFNNFGAANAYSTKQIASFYAYDGLTPAQAVALQNANIALNTALLRP